jgi:hypothetical protein
MLENSLYQRLTVLKTCRFTASSRSLFSRACASCTAGKKRTSTINEAALKALILEAVGLNKSKANEPSFYEDFFDCFSITHRTDGLIGLSVR